MKTIIKFGVVVVSTSALAFSSYIVGCKVKQLINRKRAELEEENGTVVLEGSNLRSEALQEVREESLKEGYEDVEIASQDDIEGDPDGLVLYSGVPEEMDTKKVKYNGYSGDKQEQSDDDGPDRVGIGDIDTSFIKREIEDSAVDFEAKIETVVEDDYTNALRAVLNEVAIDFSKVSFSQTGIPETGLELQYAYPVWRKLYPITDKPDWLVEVLDVESEEVFSKERKREFRMLGSSEVWNEYVNYMKLYVQDEKVYQLLVLMNNCPIEHFNEDTYDSYLKDSIIEERYNIMGSAASMIDGYDVSLSELIIHFAKLANFDTDIPVVMAICELISNLDRLTIETEKTTKAIENHTYHGEKGYGLFALPHPLPPNTSFRDQYFEWIEDKM